MDRSADAEMFEKELEWLSLILDFRFKTYFKHEVAQASLIQIPPPKLMSGAYYTQIVEQFEMSTDERLLLILALTPHLKPELLDLFFVKNANYDRGFTEFGGIKGQNFSGFMPTGETAAFVLGGADLKVRLNLWKYFSHDHFFKKTGLVSLTDPQPDEPLLSGILQVSFEYLHHFCKGTSQKLQYHSQFPATQITTSLEWDDLVLDNRTLEEVEEIKEWITYGSRLLNDWEMAGKIKPGYRVLFYGMPGTGKSLTATLIGKSVGMDVYRVDLSMVTSKYIGETEKNLANIFDRAMNKNWILFFDEADALFGKRTQTSSSNDKHSNQEVSYLLQRIEDFPGVVILASNLRANLDEAFSRRFQLMVNYAMPSAEMREKLWLQSFSSKTSFEAAIDIKEIAKKYELTGGSIINISRYCSLKAIKRGDTKISLKDLMQGIRKEFSKDGRIVN